MNTATAAVALPAAALKVRIKVAETTDEFDQLFRLRHRVYVEEDAYFAPRAGGRIYDRYDALPGTRNIIASLDGEVIGASRYTSASAAGTSAEEFYDFTAHLGGRRTGWGCGSMLCLSKAYRGSPIVQALLNLGFLVGRLENWSHMIIVANPEVELLFRRQGWKSISPTLFDEKHGLSYVAMILDLNEIRESSRRVIDRLTRPDYEIEIHAPATQSLATA